MKRFRIKPGKPPQRRTRLARKGPMKRTRRKETDDPARLARVRTLGCVAVALVDGHRCRGRRIIAHHSLTHRRGQKKSLDRYAMPLEWWCHSDLHTLSGSFEGWTKADRRGFEVRAVAWTEEQLAAMDLPRDGHGARRTGGGR